MEQKRVALLEPDNDGKGVDRDGCFALISVCLKLKSVKGKEREALTRLRAKLVAEEAADEVVKFFEDFLENRETILLIRKGLGSYLRSRRRKAKAAGRG